MASRPIDIPGRGPIAEGPMANFLSRWNIFRVMVWDEVRRGHCKCLFCRVRYLPNELVGFCRPGDPRSGNPNMSFYHRKCLNRELMIALSAIPAEPFLPDFPFRIPPLRVLRAMDANVRRSVVAPAQGSMANFFNHWSILRVIVWVEVQRGDISCRLCKKPYLPNEVVAFYSEDPNLTTLKFYHRICLRPHYECLGLSAIPPASTLPMIEFPKPLEQGSSRCAICMGEVLSTQIYFWYNNKCEHVCHEWCYSKVGSTSCPAAGCASLAADFILKDTTDNDGGEPIFEMDEDISSAGQDEHVSTGQNEDRDAEICGAVEEEHQFSH